VQHAANLDNIATHSVCNDVRGSWHIQFSRSWDASLSPSKWKLLKGENGRPYAPQYGVRGVRGDFGEVLVQIPHVANRSE
jgi:hypothetical protein